MKTDITRHKPQKWYANEDEEQVLVAYCNANNTTKSEFVRRLVMSVLHPRKNRNRCRTRREGPRLGPILDTIFPGRRVSAPMPLRL
jgi:hypothetical protein